MSLYDVRFPQIRRHFLNKKEITIRFVRKPCLNPPHQKIWCNQWVFSDILCPLQFLFFRGIVCFLQYRDYFLQEILPCSTAELSFPFHNFEVQIIWYVLESDIFHSLPPLLVLTPLTTILYKFFGQFLMGLKNENMVMKNEKCVNARNYITLWLLIRPFLR